MESTENKKNELREEILKESFGGLYEYDTVLENYISVYKDASGNKKEFIKDQILHWFLSNKEEEIDPSSFGEMYTLFLTKIERNLRNNQNIDISDFLDTKLFRESENKEKLAFILQNTDIPQSLIIKAQKLSNDNPYHNFGHQLGVAESSIRIAQAMGLQKNQVNVLALVGLFHDAGHTGVAQPDDEEIAYQKMMNVVSEEELANLGCSKDDVYKLILATKFSLRGKCDGILEKIIQDADMGSIGYGPYYMLYATMGLIDEEHASVDNYIEDEAKFFAYLEKIDPQIYLSDGARQIFSDPRESLKQIAEWPQEVIRYAYTHRQEDISFEDFSKQISAIISR